MSKCIELNSNNFHKITRKGVVLVDFWASWCSSCKTLNPIVKDLAKQFDGKAKICKVNVDRENKLANSFKIRSIPTIFFMKNGQVVGKIVGVTSKKALVDKLNSLI